MTHHREIDESILVAHPLPDHTSGDDKHDRGTALVVGGSRETPGAMLLAGLSALRGGAGRLQIALAAPDGAALAMAAPEAKLMTVGFDDGDISNGDLSPLRKLLRRADAVLVGSGATPTAARRLLGVAVEALAQTNSGLVVDAAAFSEVADDPMMFHDLASRTLLIPNDAEAAELLGVERDHLRLNEMVGNLVALTGCTVAVRGPDTYVQAPGGDVFVERSGPVGLSTSGSGDVFAGLVTGYLARGADPLAAALWAAHVHALAGRMTAERRGPIHFLARELLDALPLAQIAALP